MRILTKDDEPLIIEDHDSRVVVRHRATQKELFTTEYTPGRIESWSMAFAMANGFTLGWKAVKS